MKKRLALFLSCMLLVCCLLPATAIAGLDESAYDYDESTQTLTIRDSSILNEDFFYSFPQSFSDRYGKQPWEAIRQLVFGPDVRSVEDEDLDWFYSYSFERIVFMNPDVQIVRTMENTPEDESIPEFHGYAGSGAAKWASDMGFTFTTHGFGSWQQIGLDDENLLMLLDTNQDGRVDSREGEEANHYRQCSICQQYQVASHNWDSNCDDTCDDCNYTREVSHTPSETWSYDDYCHWKECTECHMVVGGESEPHTFEQNPKTGQMVCSVCGFEQKSDQFNLIDKTMTLTLSPGVPFTFGAGSYQVSGDPTVYNGNQNFYVRSEGNYSITRR